MMPARWSFLFCLPGAFIALAYLSAVLWNRLTRKNKLGYGLYLLILISGCICKQYRAFPVFGDLSFPRGFEQGLDLCGHVRGCPVRHDHCHHWLPICSIILYYFRWGWTTFRTITFILVIASLVQMVEIVLKKVSPPLYQALGVFLPLITTNCAVLGVAILALGLENASLLKAVFFAIANSVGFALALIVFASIREQLELIDLPEGMKGVPINLLVAGILSLAFLGFAGLV